MKTTCGKCNGSGKLPAFLHVDNGRCFACHGAGTVDAKPTASTFRAPDYDPEQELRHLYRAARSQGPQWAAEGEDNFDPPAVIAWHCVRLPAAKASRVLAAFDGILDADGSHAVRLAYARAAASRAA